MHAADVMNPGTIPDPAPGAPADAPGAPAIEFVELVQSLDAIVWEMDARTWRFTFVSDRAEHLLGYPVRRWLDEEGFWQDVLLHPDDRGWAVDFCVTATNESRDHEFLYRARAADGRTVWLKDLVRVVRDQAGAARLLRGVMVDVTREKEADARRVEMSQILERITDAFYAVDRDWRFTYVNRQAEQVLHRTAAELVGRGIWDEFPEARHAAFWGAYHRAMETGQPETFQEYYAPLDGWFEVNAYPGPEGLSVYFRDITEQRRAAQELERSRAHLFLALDAGGMGTWEWDIQGNRVIWSAQEERLYGIPEGSFEGTPEGYAARIHPDDRAGAWQKVQDALARRAETHHTVHRILRPDGEVRWLDSHGRFLYAEDGTPLRLVGVSTDVTERMRYERLRERQADMLGAVDVGAWFCDLPFDVLEWDRTVKEHFWFPPDARVTIDDFYARLHPEDRERTRQAIGHSIATRAPYDIEYRTVAPDDAPDAGAVRWVRAIGYTAYDPAGQPIRFDGITVDVTAQKRAAERLSASEQRYEYASRATSNAIWDWDLRTDNVTWNPGVYSVFGYGQGEVEETAAWWYEHIHPDDRERVVTGIHTVIDDPAGAQAWRDEYRYLRADGTYAFIVDRGYVARGDGGVAVRMIGAMEDVSERVEAEARVRRSEERFRALVDATEQYTWTTTPEGEMQGEQRGWAYLTGQPPAEYQGYGWSAAVHPDDRERSLAAWREAVAARTPLELENRVRRTDGEYRHFWVRAVPVLEADGTLREWVGVHTDVTELRAAERAVREEAEVVGTLQRIGVALASELDLDRIVQTVTDEATRLTGARFGAFFYNVLNARGESYMLYTVSGVPREEFSKFPMPRNTDVFAPTFRGDGPVRSDDITRDPRYGGNDPYFGMPRGHLPVVSYLAVPVRSHSGEVIGGLFFGHQQAGVFTARHEQLAEGIAGWAALAMDNARLFQAQEHARAAAEHARTELQRIFEQAPAAISITHGPEHVTVSQNAMSRQLGGGRDMIGRRAAEVFPEIADQGFIELQDRVYATGEPFVGNEVLVRFDRDGDGEMEEAYVNFVYQPLMDAAGAVYGIMTHAVEVTDQVSARREIERKAEELLRLTRALEESNRELDQFAYVTSHDLKAPLRGIASLAQFVEEDLEDRIDGDSREHLALLKGRVHRMEALIDGILEYSRAGRVRGRAEPVDTGALLAEVVELLDPPAGVVQVAEGMPTVTAERVPLQQVFMNLVGNALKHGHAGDARVRVGWRDAGAAWEFSVSDNGPGIAPEYHERIWGIFQTLQPRDRVEGTGIGLSVVKKIVETRGGTVAVDSAPGRGATFRFTVPGDPAAAA
jgi:PAS domain S-box-containing protein